MEILDSMLRDGAQGENISFSVHDKLAIVQILDDFGVGYIEAGNPVSNPKDMEFFAKAVRMPLKHAKLAAFGSTSRRGIAARDDMGMRALLDSGAGAVSIFGKTWDMHATEILGVTLDENLELISDAVSFLTEHGREVIFDAEHFFDGYKHNPDYAIQALGAARSAGASVLCLCDTNGGTTPLDVYNITQRVCASFPGVRIGIHCHNDIGCAVASSMMAAEAGAVHVQGTFIGIGERCGNADLATLIPNFQLKRNLPCVKGDLSRLTETVVKLSEISNRAVEGGRPYAGMSAFAHKGGMHIDGVSKLPSSFEHVDPARVGNRRRFLTSEVSGRTTVLSALSRLAPELGKSSPETALILGKIKELEHLGYQFESADASFELLILKTLNRYTPQFTLEMYRTTGDFPAPDGKQSASAFLKIEVAGQHETAAAVGNGPVNALDAALRKALAVFYPRLSNMRLMDYKVRVLSASDATAAKVRVLIESTDGQSVWTTVGVSGDIIEASWLALVDSVEYFLIRRNGKYGDDHVPENISGAL